MTLGSTDALRRFFGQVKPVEGSELISFRRSDKAGYDELAAAAILAVEADPDTYPPVSKPTIAKSK